MSELLRTSVTEKTDNFELELMAGSDPYGIQKFNTNMGIIDEELAKPPLTVNNVQPDPTTRNIPITTVPLADNLTSDEAQINTGTFIARTAGGEASIANGPAQLTEIYGNMVKTGYVAESIDMTVNSDSFTATIDRDTFVEYVGSSGTITLSYTTEWSADPSNYGITIDGTPENGDSIVIVYVKENRGTITVANPTSFVATGWNLYNHTAGYARVVKYSNEYGFMVNGTYTKLEFAETLTGEKQTITPVNGYFTVPANGYVFVTGGNATDTEIWMTWSDWTEQANGGTFEAYVQYVIDLTGLMVSFPDGLMKVGTYADEINFNTQRAYSRIEKLAYTAENLADVIAAEVPYDTDTNYIYAVRSEPVTYVISLDGEYTASDHGLEMFLGTTVPLTASALYGQDLKGKLRRDVVTISQQDLTDQQKNQVLENIGAKNVVPNVLSDFLIVEAKIAADNQSVAAGDFKDGSVSVAKTGYTPLGIVGYNFSNATSGGTGRTLVSLVKNYISGTTYTFCIKNLSNSAIKVKLGIYILYRKNIS